MAQRSLSAVAATLLPGLFTALPPRGHTNKPASSSTTEPFPSATPQAVVDVSNKIFPAVVRLDVAQEIYSEGKRNLRRGIGSGVIIDAGGHILTNYHVAG